MTFIGGFFILESSQGTLVGFDGMGLVAIFMGSVTLLFAYRINRSVNRGVLEKPIN